MAEQRFQSRVARFGDDLTVAIGIKFVDHHAVVANQFTHAERGGVGQ